MLDDAKKSDAWLLEQVQTIGSSGAGTCSGHNPYTSRRDYWYMMRRALMQNFVPGGLSNDDMRRGLLTEPLHREILQDETALNVLDHDQDEFIYHPLYPWAHALPDGWLDHADFGRIPVQLKCPRSYNWQNIKLNGIHGYWLLGTQHSIAVTGKPAEYFSVLNAETMRILHFCIERDDEIIEPMMAIEKQFFESIMNNQEPPEIIPLQPPPIGATMTTFDSREALELAQAFVESKELLDAAKELNEQCKEKIKDFVGNIEVAEMPGLRVHQRWNPGRPTLDLEAMKADGVNLSKYEKAGKAYSSATFSILKGKK